MYKEICIEKQDQMLVGINIDIVFNLLGLSYRNSAFHRLGKQSLQDSPVRQKKEKKKNKNKNACTVRHKLKALWLTPTKGMLEFEIKEVFNSFSKSLAFEQ